MCDPNDPNDVAIDVRFNGQSLIVRNLKPENTILDLKNELYKLTRVLPTNQKLLGLRTENNVKVTDMLHLSCIVFKPNMKIMLLGSTEEAIMEVNKPNPDVSDVVDDFDFKEEDVEICHLPENLEKIKRRSSAYKPRKLAECRRDKRLLVLDIDYTIFDHLTPAESALQLARPHLQEFLQRAYVNYDIAIWSATSMTWILAKLGQLGIVPAHLARSFQHRLETTTGVSETEFLAGNSIRPNSEPDASEPPFRICLLLDSSDMISVNFSERGVKEVKPLAVIWDNHPQWGPHNTIMLDDVRRNFIMNPQSGLRIRSYRDAHINYKHDRELLHIATYLELIAVREPDFQTLDHHHWDRYVSKYKHLLKRPKYDNQHDHHSHHHRHRHHHHQSNQDRVVGDTATDLVVDHDCVTPSTPTVVRPDPTPAISTEDSEPFSTELAPTIPDDNSPKSNSSRPVQESNTTDDRTAD